MDIEKYKKQKIRERSHKTTSVNLRPDQDAWLKKNRLQLSPLIRDMIDELMKAEKKGV